MSDKTDHNESYLNRVKIRRLGILFILGILFLIHCLVLRTVLPPFTVAVYPLIFMLFSVWETVRKRTITPLEIWVITNCAWYVSVNFRAVAPLVLILYAVILWTKRSTVWVYASLMLFFIMMLLSFCYSLLR